MFLGKSPAFLKIWKNRVLSRTRVQSVVSYKDVCDDLSSGHGLSTAWAQARFVIRLMKYWDFHESTMCWISAIVDVSSGHGAGTASYVNVDISKLVIRLMKYWEFHESMSQSANPPTSQIGIRCSGAKKCSEGVLKVLWRCSDGALWDVVICISEVGGFFVLRNCGFRKHWTAETLNNGDNAWTNPSPVEDVIGNVWTSIHDVLFTTKLKVVEKLFVTAVLTWYHKTK